MYEHNPKRVDGRPTWRQLRRGAHLARKTPTPREDAGQLCVAPTKAPPRRLLCTVPQKEQRIVSRQPMKSLLSSPGESIPSLSQEHVCIWIGTDSTAVPVRRHKMLGKVCQPSSAFASGTARRSEAEREGGIVLSDVSPRCLLVAVQQPGSSLEVVQSWVQATTTWMCRWRHPNDAARHLPLARSSTVSMDHAADRRRQVLAIIRSSRERMPGKTRPLQRRQASLPPLLPWRLVLVKIVLVQ